MRRLLIHFSRSPRSTTWIWTVLLMLGLGCNSQSSDIEPNSAIKSSDLSELNRVTFRLDKPNEGVLLSFYVGGMISEGQSLKSVLRNENTDWVLVRPAVKDSASALSDLYQSAGTDGVISWDEFESSVSQSYYEVRNAPKTIDDFKALHGDWNFETWFKHEVQGQMTHFRRRLAVSKVNLMSALESMNATTDPIKYPIGTAFVGEHWESGQVVEVTTMLKRRDGFWDYFAYGKDGSLISTIKKEPDPMLVPTQCVGCHFGDRLFEPERSFPSKPRPGPNGERTLFVPEQFRSAELAATLAEHAKRSDHVLGIYGTLYLSGLVQKTRAGNADEKERLLIQRLGLH